MKEIDIAIKTIAESGGQNVKYVVPTLSKNIDTPYFLTLKIISILRSKGYPTYVKSGDRPNDMSYVTNAFPGYDYYELSISW